MHFSLIRVCNLLQKPDLMERDEGWTGIFQYTFNPFYNFAKTKTLTGCEFTENRIVKHQYFMNQKGNFDEIFNFAENVLIAIMDMRSCWVTLSFVKNNNEKYLTWRFLKACKLLQNITVSRIGAWMEPLWGALSLFTTLASSSNGHTHAPFVGCLKASGLE